MNQQEFNTQVIQFCSKLNQIHKEPEYNLLSYLGGKTRAQKHSEVYYAIENLAVHKPLWFAQLIADGDISDEFSCINSKRPGAVGPLPVGVIPIFESSTSERIQRHGQWLRRVHESEGWPVEVQS